jgi:hypothetical protein
MTVIEKEEIPKFRNSFTALAKTSAGERKRLRLLQLANQLGNAFKRKVRITFCAAQDMYEVHTTVWHVSENYVSFKGGVIVPVACIDRIKLFG